MQQTECKICGEKVKMGKAINPTVQHTQWMMVFYSVDVSGKAEKNLNIKYGDVCLLFFFPFLNYYHFVMSCAFKKTRPERGSRVRNRIVSSCAANIHGLAVEGQRRQLKKKIKAEPRSLPC